MRFQIIASMIGLVITGCGSSPAGLSHLSQHARRACVEHINDYAASGNSVDSSGRVSGLGRDGSTSFLVKTTWKSDHRSALVVGASVNEVVFEFFQPDGSLANSVDFSQFRLVMDMGGRAHTTDECPTTMPEFSVVNSNTIKISNVNFIMGSRRINKWFFHKLTARVDGNNGVVGRLNVPHKVL